MKIESFRKEKTKHIVMCIFQGLQLLASFKYFEIFSYSSILVSLFSYHNFIFWTPNTCNIFNVTK